MYVIRILIVKYHNLGELLEYSCVSHTLFVEFFLSPVPRRRHSVSPHPRLHFHFLIFLDDKSKPTNKKLLCVPARGRAPILPLTSLKVPTWLELYWSLFFRSQVQNHKRFNGLQPITRAIWYEFYFKSTAIHRFPGLLRDDFEGQEKVDHTVHGFIQFNTIT